MLSTKYHHNQAYRVEVYNALRRALCGLTLGGWHGVSEDEAVDALIQLAVDIMAVEHGDDAKQCAIERIYLREVDALVDHLDGLVAWHLRRKAATEAAA
jgi:hypothetical protein